mmetsp:Transcript_39944/g.66270  ORF Transcript_39944/g.66270 Transcript_39944/m.66270 type:complete len:90 (+) Transcript_39944:166-435(+)
MSGRCAKSSRRSVLLRSPGCCFLCKKSTLELLQTITLKERTEQRQICWPLLWGTTHDFGVKKWYRIYERDEPLGQSSLVRKLNESITTL